MTDGSSLRNLPSVHGLVERELADSASHFGRSVVVSATRAVLDAVRGEVKASGAVISRSELVTRIRTHLEQRTTPFREVINATGVLLHTNLGRSSIPPSAWDAIRAAAGNCDLELDLGTGKRASRLRGVHEPLTAVTGSEAGMVVNNNAAALLLTIAALAGARPTAISRGHLVEIGGGFRLPTIVEASGSPLLEVGTTNRTHLQDYEEAVAQGAGLLQIVHRANFVMTGYVSEPDMREIIALGRTRGVPVVLDLGSGALLDTSVYGLPKELTVPKAVAMGFDAVCFSGDKLLGGPQAGFIVGRAPIVDKLRRHPLARALRCDKLQLAGLLATLDIYRRGEAHSRIPLWQALSRTADELRERAETWRQGIGAGEVVQAKGAVGGGSLPEGTLDGFALALNRPSDGAQALLNRLRAGEPPIVGHIDKERVMLHPRTVSPCDDERLIKAAKQALGQGAAAARGAH